MNIENKSFLFFVIESVKEINHSDDNRGVNRRLSIWSKPSLSSDGNPVVKGFIDSSIDNKSNRCNRFAHGGFATFEEAVQYIKNSFGAVRRVEDEGEWHDHVIAVFVHGMR